MSEIVSEMGRSKKGEISVFPAGEDTLRLRFRYKGKPVSINIPRKDHKVTIASIKLDVARGVFDPLKYKKIKRVPLEGSLCERYKYWVTTYKNGNLDTNSNFSQVYNMLSRWGNISPSKFPELLSGESLSNTTYNRRLFTLQEFLKYLGDSSSLEAVSKRSSVLNKVKSPKRLPLSSSEISLILERIKLKHPHYYPFLYFIFRTGVRNEEAVGLRIKYLGEDSITIKEVLARSPKGTNAKYRIRKETKNGKVRRIPFPQELKDIILPITYGRDPDDLVFLSPTGVAIDDRMFQKRIWKPVLKHLKIEYRNLYAARHSFGSRGIEEGIPVSHMANLMGNNVDTMVRNYIEVIEIPKDLPKL